MNLAKKIIIALIILIFIGAFSTSYSSLNLDKLIYVLAIGIDSAPNNQLEVTFQFSKPLSPESGSTETAKTTTNTVVASSLSNAINLVNSYQERQLNLSHCKIIIFSEKLASIGIENEIFTLINDTQIRPSSNIVISKCTAKDYINNTQPEVENLISKYYEMFTDSSKYTGHLPDATIGNFFNALCCQSCDAYAILGNMSTDDSFVTGVNNTRNVGVAVFRNDKLVGELNIPETISFLAIKNKVERFLISVPDPLNNDEFIDLYVTPYKSPKISVDTSTSSPYISVKCYFSARIYSMTSNSQYLSADVLNSVSNYCNSYLEAMFLDYLYATSKEYSADITGLGNYATKNFLTSPDYSDYNWLENYKNSFFKVDVNTSVKSGMLITST